MDAAGLRTAGQSAKKAECDNADNQSVKCECVSAARRVSEKTSFRFKWLVISCRVEGRVNADGAN